jgi:hypothetical protein
MIAQDEINVYIEKEMPELSGICKQEKCKTVYDVARQMIKYVNAQFLNKNLVGAKKCLTLAEDLYNSGNKTVKNAIENVFIYSFSHSFFHENDKKKELLAILPGSLYTIYKSQMLASHL